MDTWTGFFPGMHLIFYIWLIISAHAVQNAKAEITCASCPSPVQLHLEELQLDTRSSPNHGPSALKQIQLESEQLGVIDQNTGVDHSQQAGASENLPNLYEDAGLDRVDKGETEKDPLKEEDDALRRTKRSGSEFSEFSESDWTGMGAENSAERRSPGPLLDGQRLGRSESKWTRDEGRGNNRQDDPKLTSTTYALTGDSAHNHAVVYWSGQNSSVILILTKLYDFHIGSVTESTLWRSTDYGTTYERMNDKVGSKTVLSYLYVCPSNKRKIMVLTDPEFESSVLISSDEGASYQKYRLSFFILSLLFHPTQEDWALAYSHDQKLYSSLDFGRKWQLVHERVTPNRFYWAVTGLDKEPDLVHMEAHTPDGRK
ncbi:VPS10 domain-containing receptor SorCS3 [Aplochiton taeniatus]